jgi:hypothetical protein
MVSPMLVYGIRCAPTDLFGIPIRTTADYYTDYSLLVFPDYTKPLCLDARGKLTPEFWDSMRRLISTPTKNRVRVMDLDHPYISEEQSDVVLAFQESYPKLQPDWYHVPRIHS